MNQDTLKITCLEACKVIRETGAFIRQELGKVSTDAIETKSLNSLVSYVDKTAEEQLVKGLGAILPQATFLTEEETVEPVANDTDDSVAVAVEETDNDVLFGGTGNDWIFGESGDDTVFGGDSPLAEELLMQLLSNRLA